MSHSQNLYCINASLRKGQWGDIFKCETITPVPKVHPPKNLNDVRPISNLFNFNRVQEELVAELVISDMKEKMDPSQYGNMKKTSIQHYLIKMLHQILSSLDKNSEGDIFAACVTLYDYKQAFSRQSHKLGIQSFIDNGVRPQ